MRIILPPDCLFFLIVFTVQPWITLIACISIVVALSIGILFIEITTDPVELWAAPHCRARMEKDFFDRAFGPFYRTAQVFIKPVNNIHVIIHPSICGKKMILE